MNPVDIAQRLRDRRLAFEALADAAFESAWSGGQTLAQPFKFELDLLREPSGRWRDFFAATAYRPLDLPMLLLEDLGQPIGVDRQAAELALLTSAALAAASVLSSELVLGAECSFGLEHSLLTPGLFAQSLVPLTAVATDTAFVQRCAIDHWNAHVGAMLAQRQCRVQRCAPYTTEEQALLGQHWAPLKTAVFCAADHAGHRQLCTRLEPWLDEAAALYQLGRELGRITRDLARGHCSLPVASLLRAFGGTLPADEPANADQALLAAVLSPCLTELATSARGRVDRLQQAVAHGGFGHLSRGMASLSQPFDELNTLIARQGQPAAAQAPTFSLSHRPQLHQVIDAASGFLRSDPSAHEAWECYRWGYLNQAELICRVFPIGVVLEHRIAAGDDCRAEVDALFALYARNDFHYFDQSTHQPPDFDSLGLMLRLAPHGANPSHCIALLETPLRWLAASTSADGDIPVFMSTGPADGEAPTYVPVIGRRCAAVQAGVLLGLSGLGEARFGPVLVHCGNSLFRWFADSGAGSIRCYDVPYGCMLVLALVDALRTSPSWPDVSVFAEAAQRRALELLLARRASARGCPLNAAVLQLAARSEGCEALRDPTGAELLLRAQRQDGGWEAAPFYCIPSRGNLMNWHASRLVTTALAYHALVTCLTTRDLQPTLAKDPAHACAL